MSTAAALFYQAQYQTNQQIASVEKAVEKQIASVEKQIAAAKELSKTEIAAVEKQVDKQIAAADKRLEAAMDKVESALKKGRSWF